MFPEDDQHGLGIRSSPFRGRRTSAFAFAIFAFFACLLLLLMFSLSTTKECFRLIVRSACSNDDDDIADVDDDNLDVDVDGDDDVDNLDVDCDCDRDDRECDVIGTECM